MRNTLLAIVVATLPATVGAAERSRSPNSGKPATSGKLLSVKDAGHSNSCAAYGPGFAKVDGTETCVKIGGAIAIGAGVSSARH
jgi:hypothetical protein